MFKPTIKSKKAKIKKLVVEFLKLSHKDMASKITRILDSGAVNVSGWDEKVNPMILPKTITTALLQHEASLWMNQSNRTSYAKKVKKDVSNIRYYL